MLAEKLAVDDLCAWALLHLISDDTRVVAVSHSPHSCALPPRSGPLQLVRGSRWPCRAAFLSPVPRFVSKTSFLTFAPQRIPGVGVGTGAGHAVRRPPGLGRAAHLLHAAVGAAIRHHRVRHRLPVHQGRLRPGESLTRPHMKRCFFRKVFCVIRTFRALLSLAMCRISSLATKSAPVQRS